MVSVRVIRISISRGVSRLVSGWVSGARWVRWVMRWVGGIMRVMVVDIGFLLMILLFVFVLLVFYY